MKRPAALAAVALGLLVYLIGALNSPMLDRGLAARRTMLEAVAREPAGDSQKEPALAEAYWARYPDVAADAFFGRAGKLGVRGAREHYQRHGRNEGRIWGLP